MNTCTAASCPNAAVAHDLCHAHLKRRKKGLPMDAPLRHWRSAPEARFGEKFAVDERGCWLWLGHTQKAGGYGVFADKGGKQVLAHRWIYERLMGPIPEGKEIDHLCRVRRCVNPQHLEAVTRAENIRRGSAPLFQISKTHCPQGHPYNRENTRINKAGGRVCRACTNARYHARKNA